MKLFWFFILLTVGLPKAVLGGDLSAPGAELRKCLVDQYLLSACEMLIRDFQRDSVSPKERFMEVAAASYRVRSNVERCEDLFGSSWAGQWNHAQPQLSTIYSTVIAKMASQGWDSEGEKVLQRISKDAVAMGLRRDIPMFTVTAK